MYKGIGNIRRGVEDGQSTRQLATTVKGGQVVDDEREETRLGDTEEEAQGEQATKVVGGGRQQCHGTKGEHEDGEHPGGAKLLTENGSGRGEDDVGDEEDRY